MRSPRRLLRFLLVVKVLRWFRLRGGVDPIVILVILVSLPSAVVGVGRDVVGTIKIVLDFLCRICVTGLLECGFGCGYDLGYGSV